MSTTYITRQPKTFADIQSQFNDPEDLVLVTYVHQDGLAIDTNVVGQDPFDSEKSYAITDPNGNFLFLDFGDDGSLNSADQYGSGSDVAEIVAALDAVGEFEEEEFQAVYSERFPEENEPPANESIKSKAEDVVKKLIG